MRTTAGDSRRIWLVAVAAAAGTAALLGASTVLSKPTVGGSIPERIQQLERRVELLEARLQAMERMPKATAETTAVASFPSERDDLGYRACDPPYVFDAEGAKLLKAGCEAHSSGGPCDPPLVVDAAGIKTVRTGCEHARTTTPCNPPYSIDEQGDRVIRRECLDVGY